VFLQFVNEANSRARAKGNAQASLHVVFADALEERSLCGVVEEAGSILKVRHSTVLMIEIFPILKLVRTRHLEQYPKRYLGQRHRIGESQRFAFQSFDAKATLLECCELSLKLGLQLRQLFRCGD